MFISVSGVNTSVSFRCIPDNYLGAPQLSTLQTTIYVLHFTFLNKAIAKGLFIFHGLAGGGGWGC